MIYTIENPIFSICNPLLWGFAFNGHSGREGHRDLIGQDDEGAYLLQHQPLNNLHIQQQSQPVEW